MKKLSLIRKLKHQKVSVFLNEASGKIIDETAEVAGFLWQRGWAERNAGNISVRMDAEDVGESYSSQNDLIFQLTKRFQEIGGNLFLVTGKNTRMRDVAARPMENMLIIRLTDDGTGYYILSPACETSLHPTSELSAHLDIHSMIARGKTQQRVVMHTHATELVALTHIKELCNEHQLNKVLWGIHPETKVFVPAGAGFVPYVLPGTTSIGEATVRVLEKHDIALWEKHGVFAIGRTPSETFDLIDIMAKSASIYFLCRSAGVEPAGLTDSQLDELGKLKF
jgi:rhamnulose-1-phosphate aldolase